mgnify:CR=1 FL=1
MSNRRQPKVRTSATPSEWRARILKIENFRIRCHVASVVYWDVLAPMIDKAVSAGTPREQAATEINVVEDLIQSTLRHRHFAKESELYPALLQVGYSQKDALRRSRDKCAADSNRGHGKTEKPLREGYTRRTSRMETHKLRA